MTQKNNNKVFPIFLVFLCMGLGDVVGPMVALAKDTFNLSFTMAQLLTFMGFIMFGLLSIPLGVFQDKKGKKRTLMIGLMIAFVGLLIPMFFVMRLSNAAMFMFYIILGSILLLGAGATILQVAGNPIMRDVSPEGRYSSNLSLGQAIKAIGSSLGFILPPVLFKTLGLDWTVLFPIYAVLVFVALIWIKSTPITERKRKEVPASFSSCIGLLSNQYVLMMVLGIFFYVGAEVTLSSQVPNLLNDEFGIDIKEMGLIISWALFFLPILVGRSFGAVVLRKMKAAKFLMITIIVSIVGILVLLTGQKYLAFIGVVLTGLGFANIFPLIFSIAVDKMPERSNELSGLMITAVVGGAIVPLLSGGMADIFKSVIFSFIVPLLCMVYLIIIAFKNLRK